MLQNQSFETVSLQEELEATQTELFVLESVNVLTEAEDAAAGEEQGSSKLKEYAQKAKDFFIKIAKAIAEAFKKFTAFFVEAFNKLQSRTVNVEKFIKDAKSKISDSSKKLETAKEYQYLSPGALVSLKTLKPSDDRFDKVFEQTKNDLTNGSKIKGGTVTDYSSALSAVNTVKKAVKDVKASADAVKESNKEVQTKAKEGIQSAARNDNETVKVKKAEIAKASKLNSFARSVNSKSISMSNKALAVAYAATKELLRGNTGSTGEGVQSAKKDAKKAAK
ncbi:hypothetical protein CPT_MarsHill_185 [Staphylococcus phage MarsHill]|nr:hypothetical protein CPT_MarsHill_185 [Staphylococcus phage MarsHill]QQO92834.1 hypothetical protein CPT_Madawaska_184 [Staphylococcus phage Madawaska]